MEKRFHTLRIISVILKVLAWIIGLFTVIGFVAALASFSIIPGAYGLRAGLITAILILLFGALIFIAIYAGAEIIMVLLAIEENSRRGESE
ncbi:hypothetical protein DRP53_04930 [candidate division WOR-3 bacterium]|uniref:DUF4282 domain-containing protein n=1 Tax=candidate division WOR-3 bacterium TaxID=2052148 RepID=A0A660SHZ1_UNCW3|nr:MAG: hypothetical protein DRP53_04930 [candidate division WOR-3 bacterium]